jgi:protein TonB
MLHVLPESRRRSRRSTRGLVVSVVLHTAVIGAAVAGTARATLAPLKPDEHVAYVTPPPPPAPAAPTPPPTAAHVAPRAVAAPAAPPLPAPIEVPDVIPPPGTPTLPDDFLERRASGAPSLVGPPGAGSGGALLPPSDGVFSAPTVEREVVPLGNAAPRYPEALRTAGVEGEVIAEFVVDTTGRVEPATVTIVRGAHPLFETAVRDALRRMRFRAAEAGGRRVRQLVRQPFTFSLKS